MKRRDFIQKAGVAAAVSSLPLGVGASILTQKRNKIYNVGIIGYGDRGSGLHHVMNGMPEKFNIRGIAEVLPFRAEPAAKKYPQIPVYQDYRRILDDREIDTVVVSTPLNSHFEHAKAVLEAGKNLYLEKTMLFTLEEIRTFQDLVGKYPNQIIQVGHQYRYSPLYFKVKEYIQKGWLGKITQVSARWDRNNSWRRPVPSPEFERQVNWRMYKEYSGGLVAELLSHQMDFINWAFDTVPDQIFGTGGIDYFQDGRETFDNVQVTLRYNKAGMVGNFGATCGNQYEGYAFKIKGSEGTISLLTNDGIFYPEPEKKAKLQEVDGVSGATPITWIANKSGIKLVDQPTKDGSIYALEDFYRCLEEKAEPLCNVTNAGNTAKLVALANQSVYGGGIKTWKS
ncbi:Gfo/Idh/MocA family oxidoreductase [Algoriphagus kandeliae]|uniref:Gfo/Idh/MocA family oxidoreductase n=1 Tax=Algoriphagus kandeliae TaxID=2562278 RepID=A0A4Y9QZ42_9BACT|nr:Gfo/Idh/MocA family oxidoreductase [Algoriphagus kandeliae]TFV97689.1 Gfo/Idh/MocA family oxidoreductase [Algoriphagus kandeliae]